MNGIKLLADTNVIINHLGGSKNAELLLDGSIVYISSITYAELLSGNISPEEDETLKEYLRAVHVIHTNDFICELAAGLRRNNKIKLPDAIIAATSIFMDIPLITFDNDFDIIKSLKIIKLSL